MSRSLTKSKLDFHVTEGAYYTKNPYPIEDGYDVALQHRDGTQPVLAAKVNGIFSVYIIAFSNCGKCSAYIGDCKCQEITVPNSVRHIVQTYGNIPIEERLQYMPYSKRVEAEAEQIRSQRKREALTRLRKSRVTNVQKEKRIRRRIKPAPVSTEETP